MAKVLLGFMGAGKSTIARGLDPDYLDMDALIEKRLGMSIAEFFSEMGEVAFRQIESEVLADLLQRDQVVSTGGGVELDRSEAINTSYPSFFDDLENLIHG